METIEFREWLVRTNRSENTIRMYVSRVNDYLKSGLTPTEWVNRGKLDGLSASSIKMMLASIRAYHKFMGIVDGELSEYLPPVLPEPDPHPIPGGMDDIRLCLSTVTNPAHRAAIALGGFAGTRVDESVSATQDSIQMGKLIIKGKGQRVRRIPISGELEYELTRIETYELVPICNASARKAITNCFRRAGIKGHNGGNVTSHDLRATFATAVYNKNKDIRNVQRLLGHKQITTTQLYLGVSDIDLAAAVEL